MEKVILKTIQAEPFLYKRLKKWNNTCQHFLYFSITLIFQANFLYWLYLSIKVAENKSLAQKADYVSVLFWGHPPWIKINARLLFNLRSVKMTNSLGEKNCVCSATKKNSSFLVRVFLEFPNPVSVFFPSSSFLVFPQQIPSCLRCCWNEPHSSMAEHLLCMWGKVHSSILDISN